MLDVGAGDGLIAFGALELVGSSGRVIFSDVSGPLLDHCRTLADEAGVAGRCQFVLAGAEDLSQIETASVDAVTTRSVLIYVLDKRRAFAEFYRVLRTGGRISICEPINALTFPEPPDELFGFDVSPIRHIADRVKAGYSELRGPEPAMMGFDDRDLLAMAEAGHFAEIHLELHRQVATERRPKSWDAFLSSSPNPLAPTWAEVIERAVATQERRQLEAYLRPLVESGERRLRLATAHLWAEKPV